MVSDFFIIQKLFSLEKREERNDLKLHLIIVAAEHFFFIINLRTFCSASGELCVLWQ
jgi:hypothetical protein